MRNSVVCWIERGMMNLGTRELFEYWKGCYVFFSLVHSPTYPPLRAITLVARQKGRGRGVEGNGGTGWKVCKGMYINDVRNTAIDIELILKLAVCVCS